MERRNWKRDDLLMCILKVWLINGCLVSERSGQTDF